MAGPGLAKTIAAAALEAVAVLAMVAAALGAGMMLAEVAAVAIGGW